MAQVFLSTFERSMPSVLTHANRRSMSSLSMSRTVIPGYSPNTNPPPMSNSINLSLISSFNRPLLRSQSISINLQSPFQSIKHLNNSMLNFQSNGSTRSFSTRKLHGRMFWRRRPHFCKMRSWNQRSRWLEGRSFMKGVCITVHIRNPAKPNSGNRKCAKVRLTNKRRVLTYIPGMGHNLQVHSVVLVRGGRTPDVRGCNYKLVRGKYDLLPVKNRMRSRSKYAVKRPVPESKKFTGERLKKIETNEMRRSYFYRTGKELGPDDPIPHIPVQRKYPPVPIRTTWGRKRALR